MPVSLALASSMVEHGGSTLPHPAYGRIKPADALDTLLYAPWRIYRCRARQVRMMYRALIVLAWVYGV